MMHLKAPLVHPICTPHALLLMHFKVHEDVPYCDLCVLGKTGLEAAQNRLFCARGCCEFICLVLETFIQAAAARPRDEDGDIDINAEPMYKRCVKGMPSMIIHVVCAEHTCTGMLKTLCSNSHFSKLLSSRRCAQEGLHFSCMRAAWGAPWGLHGWCMGAV